MLPRRPKYVAPGRDSEMSCLMEIATGGGTILLEGPAGVGKTSLALECAHRLPRAVWLSCWPHTSWAQLRQRLPGFGGEELEQLGSYLENLGSCLFLDHLEALPEGPTLLAWCSHHLRRGSLVAIADERLPLTHSAQLQRIELQGPARLEDLPDECQLLSLRPLGLPRQVLGHPDWLHILHRRFLLREHGDWVGLPAGAGPQHNLTALHAQALDLLQGLPPSPRWVEETFYHACGAQRWEKALQHFSCHHLVLLQAGHFQALHSMCDHLLEHDPRWALAHYLRGEARAGLGKLELAQADYTNARRWGDGPLQLRSLTGRCHLLLDLGQLGAAEEDADQAILLAGQLGGRQPGQIKALNGKSRICTLRGQGRQGQQFAEQALQLAGDLQDGKGEAYSHFILAQSFAEQERWDESLQNCLNALQFARQQHEVRLTFLARYWAGAALLQMGRLEWAEEILQEAWSDSLTFPDLKMQALGELMRAQSLLAAGQSEPARQHLSRAEKLVQRSGYPLLAVRGLLLKQALHDDPEYGRQARRLADSVGLAMTSGAGPRQEVWTHGQSRTLPPETVEQLRTQSCDYDLWIDLERGRAGERQLGQLQLLGKRIPMALLLTLMRHPATAHSTESLYATVWGHDYEGETSAAQVRKNISALRNLLEPERKSPRYLLAREHAFGQPGGYYFSEEVTYFVIHPPQQL